MFPPPHNYMVNCHNYWLIAYSKSYVMYPYNVQEDPVIIHHIKFHIFTFEKQQDIWFSNEKATLL